ncbi:replication protein RepA [Klebsiella michiganensis]|nr:replication protein RepA [Klebsiella michiganensis]MBZ7312149.1 replication protein RepA [Klebsiella oxytoca]TJZ59666.1 replication protein RepA [Raoultella planticola]MBE0157739.1 replication protein RepA [Klebsiella michiganensis]MBE0193623.1 replication protein RepA [Klebsiella michiganensis]
MIGVFAFLIPEKTFLQNQFPATLRRGQPRISKRSVI